MAQEQESLIWRIAKLFAAPAIMAVFVLAGQLLVNPVIAEKTVRRTQRWESKSRVYVDAIKLVNQKFNSIRWHGPNAVDVEYKLGKPPSSADINNTYTRLALFTDNKDIIRYYLACFGTLVEERPIKQEHRITLITLMREDLGFEDIALNKELVKFVVVP